MSWFSPKLMKWCALKTEVFIESGTYKGNTTFLASRYFEDVFSIESEKDIFLSTEKRFAKNSRIKLWHSKSEEVLHELLSLSGDRRCTFWLDSHPMEPTPGLDAGINAELGIIKEHGRRNDHIILIDDYPFIIDEEPGYPTIDIVVEKLKQINENYIIEFLPMQRFGTKPGDPAIIAATLSGVQLSVKQLMARKMNIKDDARRLIRRIVRGSNG
ncbi:hypothetical protein ACFL6E_03495 [Candidatus Neomarinimicrobiota bacterium]